MLNRYYFNVNGKFGRGPYMNPDYPRLRDLLAEMDRLGIWQSVACHAHARDLNPTWGNKATLEAVGALPEAEARILPSLVVTPAMTVARGEMEFLNECLRDERSAVIELFPATNRYRFIEIERVLKAIARYKPVIMIDVTEMNMVTDIEDLVALAGRFTDMKFVLRQVMWGNFSRAFDAMLRTDNVFIDTSWLHTRGATGIVCGHAGADRLLFGLGPKSHAGAAIGALVYSGESEARQRDIAWDNFVNLLPDGGVRKRCVAGKKIIPNRVANSFWNPYLNGEGVRNTLVIDAHGHTGPSNRGWYTVENDHAAQLKMLEDDFQRFGISMFISSASSALFGDPIEGNGEIERLAAGKGAFRGYLSFNPFYAGEYTETLMDGFFERGYFVGFKFLPDYIKVAVGDRRWRPALEYAHKYHMPVLAHTWDGLYDTPRQMAEVAANYPDATFLFGHTGGGEGGRRECEAIAQDPKYSNCMFEFCGSFCNNVEWPDTLKLIDHRRVIFGTDTEGHDIGWELGRLLSMDIDDNRLTDILGLNMLAILNKSRKFSNPFMKP